ncbi:MAG: PAS domain S-box protein [Halobacteriota archaeon]
MKEQKERDKIIVMAFLLGICCALTYYFHAILGTGEIFTHFFYVPIILACIWWRRKGLLVAIFLAALLIFSHIFVREPPVTANDYIRAPMFIAIALVVATLSEVIAKARAKATHLNAVLHSIRNVNRLIAVENDRDPLIQKACSRLIATRGYHNAWIALLDESGGLVTLAEAGLGEDFLPMVERLRRGELTACGQKALTQSDVVATEDPFSTCADCPLAGKYGDRGAMVVRLEYGGNVYGLMCVSTPRDFAADEEEHTLFKEVANDIAYVLHSIELRGEREKTAEEIKKLAKFPGENPNPVLRVAKDGTILYANKSSLPLLNVWGCQIGQLLPEYWRKSILDVLSSGLSKDTEVKCANRIFSLTFAPVVDAGYANLYGLDITERKRAEEELRESEGRFRALVETTSDWIWEVDQDCIYTYASPKVKHLLGYEPEEVIGKTPFDLMLPEEAKCVAGLFQDIAESREPFFRLENTNLHTDGRRVVLETSGVPILDASGNPLGYRGIDRDITERKRAEEELRRFSEELETKVQERTKELKKERDYTRHLIESSPDFQLTLDKDGRIMDVNEAFEKIVGKSRDDLIGESIYEYLPMSETENAIVEILEKKEVRNIELTANIPGKGDLICNFSGTVFTTPEGEVGIYATGRDMTELRAKEMQLIHAGRLSSLGQMATGVAHEINQPLSIISMAAEGTLRDIEENRFDVNALPRDLEAMMRNVKRIDRIITHMRTFARKQEEWERVEPEEVLNNVFILLGEQFKQHGILFSREIDENLPVIRVDTNQLEQVFVNILTNARQVLDERGEEAKKEGERFEKRLVCGISREREEGTEWVVYDFADNAYGVPEELKMSVFEPFFTTKEPGEGTGLGLSIAYSIVTRSLNGKILVENNDMGGASFKVALPVGGQKTENRKQKSENRE